MNDYNFNNTFANILNGNIKCDKIFENESILAFNDINPKAEVHVLIIPKKPYIDYSQFCSEASVEEVGFFFRCIDEIAFKVGLEHGYKLIINNKQLGGQEIFHFHVHILGNLKKLY